MRSPSLTVLAAATALVLGLTTGVLPVGGEETSATGAPSKTCEASGLEIGENEEDCGCGTPERSTLPILTREELEKKRVKQLRKMLEERGQECKGCAEKHEFVNRVLEVQAMPIERGADGVLNSIEIIKADSDQYTETMVHIPGGTFTMGSQVPIIMGDGEGPQRQVTIDDFMLDLTEVSNAQFNEFVSATSFVSEGETFGWSFVFDLALDPKVAAGITQAVAGAEWWLPVAGAWWKEPEGPGTDVFKTNRSDHPVVHVSWADAVAYCKWRGGGRLPTEAEWEYASRAGEPGLFPWGNNLTTDGEHRANIWQGNFPKVNTAEDGWMWTSPVDAYPPQNKFGLKGMIGNVWEWVDDWWTAEHTTAPLVNPRGPPKGDEKTKKGGSFLCHKSFCYRYRSAARHKNTPDSGTSNNGFRCARDMQAA